ncbi:MAG: hypothetical protein HFJ33_06910 [Clostridia bacterium]|nr:hypothetical protein [Clostridia bacterium]
MKTNKIKKYEKTIRIILAMLTVVCMSINLEIGEGLKDTFHVFSIMDCAYVILYYLLLTQIADCKDKRAQICCAILAMIFGMCEVIGYSISRYCNLSCVIGSKLTFLKAVLKFLGYFATFYSILLFLFTKGIPKMKELKDKKLKFFTNNKRSFLIVAIIILIAYMPYFLSQYPGKISTDSITEISTALYSMDNMINHHPIAHIAIVSIFVNIGKACNDYNLGIAFYSLFQMILTASVFSFVIYYMAKRNVNFYIRLLCFLIFAFYPPFAGFAITMWKDVPFGLAMVLYTIGMIELAIQQEFLKKWKNRIWLLLSMILVILFRNNGIYVVLLSLPFMIFFTKGLRKVATAMAVFILAFYMIYKGPIFTLLKVTDGPIREALSVPLQQIARTVKERENDLTEEEKERINQYMPVNEIGELYYPLISDRVKDTLNNEAVKENKIDFITLWLELLAKYPVEYVESFLAGSYGYWYPEAKNWVIWEFDEDSYEQAKQSLNIEVEQTPIINPNFINKMIHGINYTPQTIVSAIFSIGFVFWVTVTMMVYVIYQKRYRLILAYLPVMFLWLTTIASPVWCEYRYIYSMFTTAPMLILGMMSLINNEDNKEKGIETNIERK